MKTKLSILAVLIFLVQGIYSQNAAEILNKVDATTLAPKDVYQKLTITLIDKNGRKQLRKAELWQKGADKRLFRFTEPSSYKGIGFLSLPNDVMYLYMPAYGKERRIASSVKNQKFAGTDLTYDDMEAKKYSEKYTPKLLKSNANDYVLQLIPKAKSSSYSKLILTVDKKNFVPKHIDFYDKGGNKIKTMTTTFVKKGNYWYAKTLTVKDLKRNHTTIMTIDEIKFDSGISDDTFTIRNLKK